MGVGVGVGWCDVGLAQKRLLECCWLMSFVVWEGMEVEVVEVFSDSLSLGAVGVEGPCSPSVEL